MKYCFRCGQELSDESRFCKNCGAAAEPSVESSSDEEESKGGKIALIVILSITGFLFVLVLTLVLIFLFGNPRSSKPQYDNIWDNYSYVQQDTVSDQSQADETKENDDYVIPNSDSRYVSESELSAFTEWELKVARNEIYARRGRTFKDSALQSYFNSKPWYYGSVEAKDFKETVFNEYEKANIDTIAKYEKSKGYR